MNNQITKTLARRRMTGLLAALLLCPAAGGVRGEEAAEPLTLDRAVEIALERNPEAAEAAWRLEEAAARDGLARSARWPLLQGRAAYDYYLDDQRLLSATYNGEPGVFGPDAAGADLLLRLPLYTGGRIAGEIRAADLLRQAAEGQLTRTREETVFNTTSLFYTLLAQEEVIRSYKTAVEAMTEQRRAIADLVGAGKAARVDLLRAEVRQGELEEKLERETNLRLVQRWALAELLGWEDPEPPEVAGELAAGEPEPCPGADECLERALAGRSDYAAALQTVAAREAAVAASRAGYLPSLSLLAAYGGRWMPDPEDYPAGTDNLEDVGRVGVALELPIFEGGATRSRVRENEARLGAAREGLRKLRLRIRYDIETARSEIASARFRAEVAGRAVEQARESFRIIREKYDLGKGALTDLLEAQAALVLAETSRARARADLAVAGARRQLALGEINL